MICDDCGFECLPVPVDLGIGPYECNGFRGTHHEYHDLSPCCHVPVVDGGCKVVRKAYHIAQKDYGKKIKAGQRYKLVVLRHYRTNGPSWITTKRLPT
jgi:hypothetical protein